MALNFSSGVKSLVTYGSGEKSSPRVPISSSKVMLMLQWNPTARVCVLENRFNIRLPSLQINDRQNPERHGGCIAATVIPSASSSIAPQFSSPHSGNPREPLSPAAITSSRQSQAGRFRGTPAVAIRRSARAERDVKCLNRISIREGVILDDVPHLRDYVDDLPKNLENPLQDNPAYRAVRQYFVEEDDIVVENDVFKLSVPSQNTYFRRAGPRENVVFEGDDVHAAIVTCGGLCPGLNTVIRELVCALWASYNVRRIIGIKGGYAGFYSSNTIDLNPRVVNDIHKKGGTILGTSRGGHENTKIVSSILDRGINQVYIIGGDGTQKGASAIYEELKRRKEKVAVAGIPKTIDNDIAVIDKSFGFDTAVEEAQRAINAAHVEAESSKNGIGVVKLMGRYSGYIAMHATLASRDVDCCLIPEVPFYLEGPGGLFEFIHGRLRENKHMVIVVAEGAGQELIVEAASGDRDKSGNAALRDVGLWLCQELRTYFQRREEITLKYIDPTYMIRAIPSNASDNVYCTLLAHSAMHGAMAGYTGFTVGPVNGRHAYIPISTAVAKTNKVRITDRMWARLLTSTGQPDFLQYEKAMAAKSSGKTFLAHTAARGPANGGPVPQEKKVGLENRPVEKKAT